MTEHVDDLDQLTIGDHQAGTARIAAEQAIALAHRLQAQELDISTKSAVLSNRPNIAKYVARQLAREGINIQHIKVGEDPLTMQADDVKIFLAQN